MQKFNFTTDNFLLLYVLYYIQYTLYTVYFKYIYCSCIYIKRRGKKYFEKNGMLFFLCITCSKWKFQKIKRSRIIYKRGFLLYKKSVLRGSFIYLIKNKVTRKGRPNFLRIICKQILNNIRAKEVEEFF